MNNRSLVCAAVVASLSSSAEAQNFLLSDPSKALIESYLDCVVREATKLEPAGEVISDTVEFGKTACAERKLSIALGVVSDVNTRLPKVSPDSALKIIQDLRESVYEQVTAEARLRLAKVRLERVHAAH